MPSATDAGTKLQLARSQSMKVGDERALDMMRAVLLEIDECEKKMKAEVMLVQVRVQVELLPALG